MLADLYLVLQVSFTNPLLTLIIVNYCLSNLTSHLKTLGFFLLSCQENTGIASNNMKQNTDFNRSHFFSQQRVFR